jgi:type IV fimbrial biogenesis protein FimT
MMKPLFGRAPRRRIRAVSLIELMVVIAVGALIIGLAAPSFTDYIVTQRVRSVHAQLATDLQFARSEAISRNTFVSVRFQFTTGATGASCYIIFTRPEPDSGNPVTCDCLAVPASRCATSPATTTEVRTVTVPNELSVNIRMESGLGDTVTFDPRSGGLKVNPLDYSISEIPEFSLATSAASDRRLLAIINASGRANLCTPSGSRLGGTSCP